MDGTDLKMRAPEQRAALGVEDSALLLKRFYFLQRELVMMQAGWLPGMEPWQIKMLLPELLWQDALIAGELRQRVLELRYPERTIDVWPDDALVERWRRLSHAPDGLAFAQALATVVKPMLRKVYRAYLDAADHLDDGPTVRIIRQAIEDIDEQVQRWGPALDDATAAYPEHVEAADRWSRGVAAWCAPLERSLAQADGACPDWDPADHGGRPFRISRHGERDRRFGAIKFSWPDSLDPTRGAGEGFELQVRQAQAHINEVWASEMAAACLFDLADGAPFDFLLDAARWCYDEIRHCRMGYTRLRDWGFTLEQMPMGYFSYDAGADGDAIARLGIIFYFESTYIHTKPQRKKLFGEFGDRVSSHDMDFDWADEQIHAHYGARWLKHFLEEAGDDRRPVDFRDVAESLIRRYRERATDADRQATERMYERTMARARELAGRDGAESQRAGHAR